MRNIIWFLVLTLLLILQAGILIPLNLAPVSLILIVVALSALLSEFNQGLIITILGGLLLDFVSGLPDGIFTISLLLVFLFMYLVLNEILAREANKFIMVVAVVGSTILYFVSIALLSYVFSWFDLVSQIDLRYLFASKLPIMLFWNLVFTYPVFVLYIWIQNLVSKLPTNEEPIRT